MKSEIEGATSGPAAGMTSFMLSSEFKVITLIDVALIPSRNRPLCERLHNYGPAIGLNTSLRPLLGLLVKGPR